MLHRLILLISLLLFAGCCSNTDYIRQASGKPLQYAVWDTVLARHVDESGYVNYEGVKSDSVFWEFIGMINSARPSEMGSDRERLAFWINAYNALTFQLIVDNLPLESITDIASGLKGVVVPGLDSPWELEVARIEGIPVTLQAIEDEKVRKLGDERVHFAINCASISCPKVMRRAYTQQNLDILMNEARVVFLANVRHNHLKNGKLYLSKIFDWYSGDFESAAGSVLAYAQAYWPDPEGRNRLLTLTDDDIEYLDYDWSLVSQDKISKE